MFISTQAANALSAKFDPNASSDCWCNKTMCETGADDDLVSFPACCDAARPCYQAL